MDWALYADRDRFNDIPMERMFVLQGHIEQGDEGFTGRDWHVFLETADFNTAWASVRRPGIVVTETEMLVDPVLTPLLEVWRSGDDTAFRRFMGTAEDGDDRGQG